MAGCGPRRVDRKAPCCKGSGRKSVVGRLNILCRDHHGGRERACQLDCRSTPNRRAARRLPRASHCRMARSEETESTYVRHLSIAAEPIASHSMNDMTEVALATRCVAAADGRFQRTADGFPPRVNRGFLPSLSIAASRRLALNRRYEGGSMDRELAPERTWVTTVRDKLLVKAEGMTGSANTDCRNLLSRILRQS